MISQHISIALRTLRRKKGFTILNVIGLSVGVTAVLLLYRIVAYETSFNKHFSNYERIVRAVTYQTEKKTGEVSTSRGIIVPAMLPLAQTVPQLVAVARVHEYWPTVIVPNPTGGPAYKKFVMDGEDIAFFADSSFCQIFDFQWLSGTPEKALHGPRTVVLTQQLAEKCFADARSALGQTLLIDDVPMIVDGVISDPPVNTDIQFKLLVSYRTLLGDKVKYSFEDADNWGSLSSNDLLFGLLSQQDQFAAADALVQQIGDKELNNERIGGNWHTKFVLSPLSEMHFDERFQPSTTAVITPRRLQVLSGIGFLVLLMACFNFINMATAQALQRAKEVGVRKTLGGGQRQLVGQFMAETAIVVGMALVIGAIMAWISAPLLTRISTISIALPFWSQPMVWVFLIGLWLLTTLLSGAYPALVLAGFRPVQALRSQVSPRTLSSGQSVRKGLVVCQFVIAQALIVGTLVTLSQLSYIRNLDLGFRKDLVYTFDVGGDSTSQRKLEGFKQRLLQIPSVESVTFGSDRPASGNTWATNFAIGLGSPDQNFSTTIKFCDADFAKTYGLQLVAGRWLSPSDTLRELVVNETLLRRSGIQNYEEALQKEIRLGAGRWKKIVGVVKDFHAHSLHQAIEPLVMGSSLKRMYATGVRIRPENVKTTTEAIRGVYDEMFTQQVFAGKFLDESLAEFYEAEEQFSNLCKGFGGLAIFIACLGLLGLAAHAAQRRTKEIGIRKVLGASAASVVGLLSKDFLRLVLVALVIATPIAYYALQQWLADFAYRIEISWWMFALTGVLALLVAFGTVSLQSLRAALVNPVKSLRSE